MSDPLNPEDRSAIHTMIADRMADDSAAWFPAIHARGFEPMSHHYAYGLGGETGEVLDVLKKADICGFESTCDLHADGKHDKAALAGELADVFTYLLLLARHHDIDIVGAWLDKRNENIDRWGQP